ncbi:hypothetical protein EGW08_015002, partial [Elysia chlorotica]
ATGLSYIRDWLFCAESVALFVSVLFLINCLRFLRAVFVCFCRWKYRNADTKSNVKKQEDSLTCNAFGVGRKNYSHEAKTYDMGVFSIQGRRKTMEDRFNFIEHSCELNHSMYAVFDGHGGEFAAEYVEDQLFRAVYKEITQTSFESDSDSVRQMINSVVRTVDAQLVCLSRDRMDLSGSTAIIAFQKNDDLIVANIGDSRAIMCDLKGKITQLSTDHKPCDPKEQQRIVDAGGFVTFNGVWRVAGVLATSRAFGDYPLKQRKFVTVEPEFTVHSVEKDKPHFIVLASDGLWDVFSNEDVVQFISERLDEPHFGAKSLALQAYYRGSLDNITIMVINFKRKRALQCKFEQQRCKAEQASSQQPKHEEAQLAH